MVGHDASRQVSGFSCPRVKNSKTKKNFRAGNEDGKYDEDDDDPGEI